MKRLIILLLSGFFLPFIASGEHFFIWNYDPLDIFYDAQIGDSIDCSYWVEQTLTANGHTFIKETFLPTDLSAYDAVFVLLGWFRC